MALFEDFSSKELLVFVPKITDRQKKGLNYFIINHKFKRKGRSVEYFIILKCAAFKIFKYPH